MGFAAGRSVIVSAAILALLALHSATAAFAAPIAFSGSMEGDLKVTPGSWLSAGYRLKQSGGGTVKVADATVTMGYSCMNGLPGGSFELPLDPGPYSIPAGSSDWYPTNTQSSHLSYQGSMQVPDLCGGEKLRINSSSGAASFAADIQSTNTVDKVSISFHYRIPAAKNSPYPGVNCADPAENTGVSSICGASWSATKSVIPTPLAPDPV